MVLTETRWSFSAEWSDDAWHFIHSGTKEDRADGILVLLRRSLCTGDSLSLVEPMPGRILHIRLAYRARAFDLIACYQFADTRMSARHAQRTEFWQILEQHAQTLPQRNSLLYAGDFNCSLPKAGHHVGTDRFCMHGRSCTGPLHTDHTRFLHFVKQFDLTALNSWNGTLPPTFYNASFGSRIDFFLQRHADSDELSKRIIAFPDAEFLPISGAHHIPLVCTVPKIPLRFTQMARMTSCSYQQRMHCRQSWLRQDERWQQFTSAATTTLQNFSVDSHSADTVIDQMHAAIMPHLQNAFPKLRPADHCHTHHDSIIRAKWFHHRTLKAIFSTTLPSLFRAWHHWSCFHKLKKEHARHVKDLRKQRFRDLLNEVDRAARLHDSFGMHQIINRFSPKQPKKRIRIPNADGTPATSNDVVHLTTQFIKEIWDGPTHVAFTTDLPFTIPFTKDELAQELRKMPVAKSVAQPFVPGLFWKTQYLEVANHLYALLGRWWRPGQVYIPPQWKQAWIAFLPKPQKSPDRLMHLRPIALQEPLGKTVMGLLNRKLLGALLPFLVQFPQFAFLCHRSAQDAIRKVSSHCQQTRTLLRNSRRTVHHRAMAQPTYQVCGGIQVFIDISRAFDLIARQPLFDFLGSLPIDQCLVGILAEWHTQTSYITCHNNVYHETPTGRGVRQGCRVAPTLWACCTHSMFSQLSSAISSDWVRNALTVFADDIHCGEIFTSAAQLCAALRRLGILFDVLANLHLQVSYPKSALLLALSGTNSRTLQTQLIKCGANGPYVEIPRSDGSCIHLPVKSVAGYLGVQMHYSQLEILTLRRRMQSAQLAFIRLRRWLCSRHVKLASRLQLWRSCIYSTLIYGLFATDIPFHGIQKLHTFIMGHLRKVVGDHSYLTGLTHGEFLHQYQLEHPIALLLHSVRQLRATLSQRLNQIAPDDHLHTVDWSNLDSQEQLLIAAWHAQDPNLDILLPAFGSEAPERLFSCEWCLLRFDSLSNLRRHQTNVHGQTQLRTVMTTVASHATHGLPTCSPCHKSFVSWRNFSIHLERNCCQVILSGPS